MHKLVRNTSVQIKDIYVFERYVGLRTKDSSCLNKVWPRVKYILYNEVTKNQIQCHTNNDPFPPFHFLIKYIYTMRKKRSYKELNL